MRRVAPCRRPPDGRRARLRRHVLGAWGRATRGRVGPRGAATGAARYGQLLRYALPHWRGRVLIVGATLLSTALALLQPWPMQFLVDHVLGQQPLPPHLAGPVAMLPGADRPLALLGWVALAGVGIFGLTSALDVVLTIAWIRVGQGMVYDLEADLFARTQRRSLLFHSRHPVGDSMSRITADSWAVQAIVDTLVFAPLHAAVSLAAALLVMVRMDVGLTLLALAVAPFMASAAVLFGRPSRRAAELQREIEGHLQSHVQQTLTGLPVVQAFGQEERTHRRFELFTTAAIGAQQQSTLVGHLHGLSAGLVTTLGTAAILALGGRQVLEGRLTVGGLLVFLAYLGGLQAQIRALADSYRTLQVVGPRVDRVLEVLGAEREVADRPGAPALPPARGHVRLEGVTAGYAPGRPVLRDVALEARPGETVALVGPTGAGKSTLVGLVPRFLDPWAGRVLVDGRDVRDVQLASLRRQVAVVLQEPFLLPLTVAENIAYGRPGAPRAAVEAAARAANAHEFAARLPRGYDTPLGERGATLSGGERQRLAIARALLTDAPILLLDEPTSALDAVTEAAVLEALGRLAAGRTTLVIAHRLSTVRRADRVVVLEGGRVAEAGPPGALLARGGAYARLHAAQFGPPAPPAVPPDLPHPVVSGSNP